MAKWTLKLHNPQYRGKPFNLEIEGASLDELITLLTLTAEKMKELTEAMDRSER